MKRLPLIPTLMTLIMVGVMLRLSYWQYAERLPWKHKLIAQLEAAQSLPPVRPAEFFKAMVGEGSVQYRRAVVACRPGRVVPYDMRGGESASGQSGFLVVVACGGAAAMAGKGPAMVVVAGFSARPEARPLVVDTEFDGTVIERPYGTEADRPMFMLIPKTAVAPLTRARQPTPGDLPDSHLSYAFQWLAFAVTLAAIYAIWLRRRYVGERRARPQR